MTDKVKYKKGMLNVGKKSVAVDLEKVFLKPYRIDPTHGGEGI